MGVEVVRSEKVHPRWFGTVTPIGECVECESVGAVEIVDAISNRVPVGKPRAYRRPDGGGCLRRDAHGRLAQLYRVCGQFSAGRLKREVGEHVRGHRVVAGLFGRLQRGEEVSLGQSMPPGVVGHPARELAKFSECREQAAFDVTAVAALVEEQRDGAELCADVGKVGGAAVGVVEAL